MTRKITPSPTREQADAVNAARDALDRALAGRGRAVLPPAVLAGLERDYTAAVAAAGAHQPPPANTWPSTPPSHRPPGGQRKVTP